MSWEQVTINRSSCEPLNAALNQCYIENGRMYLNYALYGIDVRQTGMWLALAQVTGYSYAGRTYFPTTYTVQPDTIEGNLPGVAAAFGVGKMETDGRLFFYLPQGTPNLELINCVHFNFSIRVVV
ncbi:hypothetical protein GPL15_20350 [Clostridium sp. MCC353]|uniref:hypothetical protein n=1 Tax=Clostridium sp. MCC353 TaxID=2592646 RepID=UPI001C013C0E|nr:hypothetical protein [Clostridium sp. MCC353]MBT9778834.1 hypothetical protein [Clostridium sp. MCC353]